MSAEPVVILSQRLPPVAEGVEFRPAEHRGLLFEYGPVMLRPEHAGQQDVMARAQRQLLAKVARAGGQPISDVTHVWTAIPGLRWMRHSAWVLVEQAPDVSGADLRGGA